jgi:uncharacterized protein (TIGR00730 family)
VSARRPHPDADADRSTGHAPARSRGGPVRSGVLGGSRRARSVAVVRSEIRRVAVFCGSTSGADPEFARRSYEVGRELAERGIGVVYGAGGHGLMREVSQGALDAGGDVVGVIPRSMVDREWGRDDLTDLHVVDTMHERKAKMVELADAFLGLPGGLGTLEEIIEVWSWRPIGFNGDPVGLLDINGFWSPLLDALERLVQAGFVRREVMDDLVVAETLPDALERLAQRRTVTFGDKLDRSSAIHRGASSADPTT